MRVRPLHVLADPRKVDFVILRKPTRVHGTEQTETLPEVCMLKHKPRQFSLRVLVEHAKCLNFASLFPPSQPFCLAVPECTEGPLPGLPQNEILEPLERGQVKVPGHGS